MELVGAAFPQGSRSTTQPTFTPSRHPLERLVSLGTLHVADRDRGGIDETDAGDPAQTLGVLTSAAQFHNIARNSARTNSSPFVLQSQFLEVSLRYSGYFVMCFSNGSGLFHKRPPLLRDQRLIRKQWSRI